jgi:large subunit ribosomal protein L24
MRKIRKGDLVEVLSGSDKGKRGTVLRVDPDLGVFVEGVNRVKRATKPNPLKGTLGGISEKEMPMGASKLSLVDLNTKLSGRVSFTVAKGAAKVRVVRSSGASSKG